MEKIDGVWYMSGLSRNDRSRIKNIDELIGFVEAVGFVPLFANDIEGFSVEERSAAESWWTGADDDPWEMRELAACSHRVAYGKFFGGKAGFISLSMLPHFINFRRDGYDFDSLWDEGKAKMREKKIMDLFTLKNDWFSYEIKKTAGFGKGKEKNFDGTINSLMQKLYVVMCDFQKKRNKKGEEYGLMKCARYCTPEALWGYDEVTREYVNEPGESRELVLSHLLKLFPAADKKAAQKLIG
ncbi:MAG: hypothetical protein IJ740_04335 [Ruminococcus sp.]|nr:hypothetical protein [Ruminococcus sp.]